MKPEIQSKILPALLAIVFLCVPCSPAAYPSPPPEGNFTSLYEAIYVEGNFHRWNNARVGLSLVADHLWAGVVTAYTPELSFIFEAHHSPGTYWGDAGQITHPIPLEGIATQYDASTVTNFIRVETTSSDHLKFYFCETSGAYRVESTDEMYILKHYFVDASRSDDSGSGRSWATAKRTIQAAIDAAASWDTIWVTNGLYEPIRVPTRLTVRSVNGPEYTIIDGGNTQRCAVLGSSYSPPITNEWGTLVGFTLQNGYVYKEYGGGAVGGILKNCIIRNNTADGYDAPRYPGQGAGGGVSRGVLYNCLLVGNYSANEGGAGIGCTFYNCTIISNRARYGGGTYSGAVYNCVVLYNIADENENYDRTSVNFTCTTPVPNGEGNFFEDPLFVDMEHFRLSKSSSCINAGNNQYMDTEPDLDGNSRLLGEKVDLGAYEIGGEDCAAVSVAIQGGGIVSPMRQVIPIGTTAIFTAYPADPQCSSVQFFTNGVYAGNSLTLNWLNVQEDSILTVVFPDGRPTRFVDASKPDDSGNGLTWETAKRTIQSAVDISNQGDAIHVAEGTYGSVTLKNRTNIFIHAVAGAERTIMDGGSTNRCFTSSDGSLIHGFTLQNGYAQKGGGISLGAASNCIISNNATSPYTYLSFGEGAGTYYTDLINCMIISNHAVNPGGRGGGMFGGTASNCQLIGNSSDVAGGAMMAYLTHCTVQGNRAQWGGGTVDTDMDNCLLYGNHAEESGAGGCANGKITNCTIVMNTAPDAGGAWAGEFKNCILWGNKTTQGLDDNYIRGTDYPASDINNSCTTPLPVNGTGNMDAYPYFVDLENGDFRLQSLSLCVDAGNNEFVTPDVDLAGNPRIQNGHVDMGAFEGGVVIPMTITTEIPVPYTWLDQYNLAPDGNYEAAAHSTNTHDGRVVWEHYLTATDPTDSSSIFKVNLAEVSDVPVITWTPNNPARIYRVEGDTNLATGNWDASLEESQFFRATVSMPPTH